MENYSKQREEILDVLKDSYNHPTTEEIYNRVKQRNSTSSRGTVYRNLKLLVDKNAILKISMSGAPDRYDFVRRQHSHFICVKCNRVFDFEYDFKSKNLEKKLEADAYSINENSFTVSGICKECFNKKI